MIGHIDVNSLELKQISKLRSGAGLTNVSSNAVEGASTAGSDPWPSNVSPSVFEVSGFGVEFFFLDINKIYKDERR